MAFNLDGLHVARALTCGDIIELAQSYGHTAIVIEARFEVYIFVNGPPSPKFCTEIEDRRPMGIAMSVWTLDRLQPTVESLIEREGRRGFARGYEQGCIEGGTRWWHRITDKLRGIF